MIRSHSLWLTLFASLSPPGLALAQVEHGRWTPVEESLDRGYSSISYWTYRDDGVEIGGGRVSVEHGKPSWPSALDESSAFDAATVGKLWRLGNNKWTTLDTNLTLVIGDRAIEPGIYYLVVQRPEKGDWRLGFVDPSKVMPGLIDAWASQARPDEVPIAFSVPLTHAYLDRSSSAAPELDITIGLDASDMMRGFIRIDWGPHRLDTAMSIKTVTPTFYRGHGHER